mgnify:CR=1 FL=1
MPKKGHHEHVREKLGPPGKRSDHSKGGEHMQGIDADRLPAADAACGVFNGAPLVAHGVGRGGVGASSKIKQRMGDRV